MTIDTEKSILAQQKYSMDSEFQEPILRCDGCQDIIFLVDVTTLGQCPLCGNMRVRMVTSIRDDEQEKVNKWVEDGKLDPMFLDLFAPVETVGGQ